MRLQFFYFLLRKLSKMLISLRLRPTDGGIKCWGFRGSFIINQCETNQREQRFAKYFNPNIL
jgi:hypothetical protein